MPAFIVSILQPPGDLGNPAQRLDWLSNQLEENDVSAIDLLLLPELFQAGYNAGENFITFAEPCGGNFAQGITALCKKHDLAIVYGYAEQDEKLIYNSAQAIDRNGLPLANHRKLMLPPGHEKEIFEKGTVPTIFDYHGIRIGLLICYDAEFPENMRFMAQLGAELILVPTALLKEWEVVANRVIPSRAFENGCYVAYANHCGSEKNLHYLGGSCIVSPVGADLSRANDQSALITAEVSKKHVQSAQSRLPYLLEAPHALG
jgi:predicted amidohydrolase